MVDRRAPSGMVGSNSSNSKQLSSYYESLRSNVMSILGQVKVPCNSNEMVVDPSNMAAAHGFSTKENFDSYLTKLQTICTENMSEEVKALPTPATTTLPTSI